MLIFNFLKNKNKYTVITSIFIVWVLFISDHDLFFIFRSCQVHYQLINQKELLQVKILEQEEELKKINSDMDYLENYARRKYYFKKNNEVIFLDAKNL